MTAMQAMAQRRYGDPSRLRMSLVDRPEPGPTEVLVKVEAAGLSPGDRAMITGVPYVNRLAASGLRGVRAGAVARGSLQRRCPAPRSEREAASVRWRPLSIVRSEPQHAGVRAMGG